MPSYWWECEECRDRMIPFDEVAGVGVVTFLWDQLSASG